MQNVCIILPTKQLKCLSLTITTLYLSVKFMRGHPLKVSYILLSIVLYPRVVANRDLYRGVKQI